jgi:hypothetical protein
MSVNSKGKRYCDCGVCDSMTEAGCPNAPTLYTGGKDYCYWCAPYPNGPEDPANRHVNHEWTPEERGFIISHVYSINQLAEKQ